MSRACNAYPGDVAQCGLLSMVAAIQTVLKAVRFSRPSHLFALVLSRPLALQTRKAQSTSRPSLAPLLPCSSLSAPTHVLQCCPHLWCESPTSSSHHPRPPLPPSPTPSVLHSQATAPKPSLLKELHAVSVCGMNFPHALSSTAAGACCGDDR